jgi:hypothetical protein
VRTTLTLDDDVAAKLKAQMRKTGKPFKEVVNEALRVGLLPRTVNIAPFQVEAKPLGLRPGLNRESFAALLEQIEDPLDK